MSPSLKPREWLAVLSFLGALVLLTLITLKYPPDTGIDLPKHHVSSPVVAVRIEGAVEKPGVYTVPKGTLVLDAIREAIPLPEANLKKVKATSKVRNRQVITVVTEKKGKKAS